MAMNVYSIAVVEKRDAIYIGEGRLAIPFEANDEIVVHGADNLHKALGILMMGKTVHEVRDMICPNCYNFHPKGKKCDCMNK